jgi:subtilisin family serine protease
VIAGLRRRAGWLIWLVWLPVLEGGTAVPPAVKPPDPTRSLFRPDRILAKPKAGATLQQVGTTHALLGNRILRSFPELDNWQVIQLTQGLSVPVAISNYHQSGLFEWVEPDFYVHATANSPNDPEYQRGTLWALHNHGQNNEVADADIDALEAWNLLTSAETLVAVIDSGIRVTHEDLVDNLWTNPGEIPGNGVDDDHNGYVDDVHGINALDGDTHLTDTMGHGTAIAGIIGALGNNGKGTVGVAWRVQIMVCKFFDQGREGSISGVIECLNYARIKKAKIVNASWVDTDYSQALYSALNRARSAGMIIVAAAGNGTLDIDVSPIYPPAYNLDNIVTVAASTRTNTLANFSNYGAQAVHLAAPGTDIYGPWLGGDNEYAYFNGTSMAAPFVTGSLALLWTRYPNDSHTQIIKRLLAAVDPLPVLEGKCRTGGRLNLHRALAGGLSAAFTASPTNGPLPLAVTFTDDSVGTVTQRTWNFGDRSLESHETNAQHTYTNEGTFTATLTVTGTNGVSRTYDTPITTAAHYQISATNFSWLTPERIDTLVLGDDEVSPAMPMPFSFFFYGRSYDFFYVSANGTLGFSRLGLESPDNFELPRPFPPNAMLCPYWGNLNPAQAGTIYVGTTGVAPARKLVVSWVGVPLREATNVLLTFQAQLEESTQHIIFQYQETHPEDDRGGGRRATIGIENETGFVGTNYAVNGQPHVLSNQVALVFQSTSIERMTVTPETDFTSAGKSGGPFAPLQQSYAIQNLGANPLTWRAQNTQTWLRLSATNGIVPTGATTNLSVALTPLAFELGQGQYHDTVLVLNDSTGLGSTGRAVAIEVGPPEPARLEPLGWNPSQPFSLRLYGDSLRSYRLEGSLDLTNWLALSTNATTIEGTTVFQDPVSTQLQNRFYRSYPVAQ